MKVVILPDKNLSEPSGVSDTGVSPILIWKKTRHAQIQWEIFRIQQMEVLVPFLRPYSLKFRPYIGLIYGRYLQSRFLKLPLTNCASHKKGLSEDGVPQIPMDYHQSSDKPICILGDYGIPHFQTKPTWWWVFDPYQKLLWWMFLPPVMVLWPDIHTW